VVAGHAVGGGRPPRPGRARSRPCRPQA
jgi:hypothetical protein